MKIEEVLPMLKMEKAEEKSDFGKFVFEPLQTGFGHTLGNAIRRVLLSSLEGAAVTYFKVDGVSHQFSTLTGVKEDMVQLSLNLKKLRIRIFDENPVTLKCDLRGPREVKASDLEVLGNAEVVNKDLVIATLADSKTKFVLEAGAEKGIGYIPAEERPVGKLGTIVVDSVFTPIVSVVYNVEPARVGRETNLDRLILEIKTDGSVDPSEALKKAIFTLLEYFKILSGERVAVEPIVKEDGAANQVVSDSDKKISIEDLGFSTRTTNALQSGKINTLGDLLEKSGEDLLKLRGFGQKAVSEVDKLLKKQGWR